MGQGAISLEAFSGPGVQKKGYTEKSISNAEPEKKDLCQLPMARDNQV
jgi:hypothetical protein